MEHPLGYDQSDPLTRKEEREGLVMLLMETVIRDCDCDAKRHPVPHERCCAAYAAHARLLELAALPVAR